MRLLWLALLGLPAGSSFKPPIWPESRATNFSMKSGPVRLTLGNPLDPRVLYHVIVTLALGALSLARRLASSRS
jgi:hypothetical protein